MINSRRNRHVVHKVLHGKDSQYKTLFEKNNGTRLLWRYRIEFYMTLKWSFNKYGGGGVEMINLKHDVTGAKLRRQGKLPVFTRYGNCCLDYQGKLCSMQ
jgi:hypothetical protein